MTELDSHDVMDPADDHHVIGPLEDDDQEVMEQVGWRRLSFCVASGLKRTIVWQLSLLLEMSPSSSYSGKKDFGF